jgi:putative peptidoglycan lipid II flippase
MNISANLMRLSLLRDWSAASVNRKIFAGAFTVGGFTLSVKCCALLKEQIIAFQFGASSKLGALLIAWALPTFCIGILGASVQSAFVPIYLDVLHARGRKLSTELVGSASILYLLLLSAVAIGILSLSPWLLSALSTGFTESELAACQHIFYVILPVIVLTGLARLWEALLLAEHNYAVATIATVATPLLSIFCMLLFVHSFGIYSLAVGILVGALVEVVFLALVLRLKGLSFHLAWHGRTEALDKLVSGFFPVMGGSLLLAGATLTDQAMAGMMSAGAVTTLNYANKITALILGLTSAAIGTAILPYLSQMVAAADWTSVRRTYQLYVKLILIGTIPATFLFMLISKPLVRVLFERGSFTTADTAHVSWVQICFLIQVPFYTLGVLAARLISALQINRLLMWGSLISLSLNGILDYILMKQLGVAGIALSTSCVYAASFAYLHLVSTHTVRTRSRKAAESQLMEPPLSRKNYEEYRA